MIATICLVPLQAQTVSLSGQLALPADREAGAILGLAADHGYLFLFTVNAAYRYDLSEKDPIPLLYTDFSSLRLRPTSAFAFVPSERETPRLFLTTEAEDLHQLVTLALTEGRPEVINEVTLEGIRNFSAFTLAADPRTGALLGAADDGIIYDLDPTSGKSTQLGSIEKISTITTGEQSRVVLAAAGGDRTFLGSSDGGFFIDRDGKVTAAPKELSDNHRAGYDSLLAPPLVQGDFFATMNRDESAFFTFRDNGEFTGSSPISSEVLRDAGFRQGGVAQLVGGPNGNFYYTSGTGDSIWIFNAAAIPEPASTGVALALGALLLAAVRRSRSRLSRPRDS